MSYTKLKKTTKKEVELMSGKKTWVLELIFKNGDDKLRVLIKDLVDKDDKHIIKEATIQAKKYFKDKQKKTSD